MADRPPSASVPAASSAQASGAAHHDSSNLRHRPPSQQSQQSQPRQPPLPPQSSVSPANPPAISQTRTEQPQLTPTPPPPPPSRHNPIQNQTTLRNRVMAGALGVGIVTAAVGGTYLLSENDAVFPFAVAACVATFSSVLLRFALVGITGGAANNRARVRHFRHHRHFTGERAAYVRTSQRLAMMDRDFTAADYDLLLDLDNNSQRLRRFLEGASMETVSRLPTFIFRDVAKERNEAHANEDENATSNNITDIDQTTEPESRDDQSADDEDVKPSKSSDSKAVDRLQYITSDDSELAGATSKSCTICLEDFEEGMKIRILPCFHRFMAECIDPWLVQQARCPVCKCGIQDVMNTSMQEVMNTLPSGCS